MKDYKFTAGLPPKVNDRLLQHELLALNADTALSIDRDGNDAPVRITIHAPDSVTQAQCAAVIAAHAPTKSTKEELTEKKQKRAQFISADKIEELEQRIAVLEAAK